jgi:PH domain
VVQAALETYLQTLINLPVKNKDEVIAFFCSDIVRETKKPVYQAGYKEGYLTKRGKNFGGWKSRYFVLQGPVLEYYESVSLSLIEKISYLLNSIYSEVGRILVPSLSLGHRSAVSNGQAIDGNQTTRKSTAMRSLLSKRRRDPRATVVHDTFSVLRAIAIVITGSMYLFDMSWDRTTMTLRHLMVLVKRLRYLSTRVLR